MDLLAILFVVRKFYPRGYLDFCACFVGHWRLTVGELFGRMTNFIGRFLPISAVFSNSFAFAFSVCCYLFVAFICRWVMDPFWSAVLRANSDFLHLRSGCCVQCNLDCYHWHIVVRSGS